MVTFIVETSDTQPTQKRASQEGRGLCQGVCGKARPVRKGRRRFWTARRPVFRRAAAASCPRGGSPAARRSAPWSAARTKVSCRAGGGAQSDVPAGAFSETSAALGEEGFEDRRPVDDSRLTGVARRETVDHSVRFAPCSAEAFPGDAMTIAARRQGLSDVAPGGWTAKTIEENFSDLHPPLSRHEAKVEAERCYFCFDAPCQQACPTSIDIPLFIRQIAADNRAGAAKTIFDANIMGGMCARVCPTETLCEEACVREAAEGKPVRIGLLQRYATDALIETGKSPYDAGRADRQARRDRRRGAGRPRLRPCARVAGVDVDDLRGARKPGGLNEYGIAAYKTVDDFAAREAAFILSVGGIEVQYGVRARPARHARRASTRLRRRVSRHRARRDQQARPAGRGRARQRRRRGRLHRRPPPGAGSGRRCRSAGASSSSAAA